MTRGREPAPVPEDARGAAAGREADSLVQPLDRLGVGEAARVVYVSPRDPDRLVRLSSLGVVPGARLHVQQRLPATVVRLGETVLAFDPAIAGDIYVEPCEGT